jgi:hypothetical protein
MCTPRLRIGTVHRACRLAEIGRITSGDGPAVVLRRFVDSLMTFSHLGGYRMGDKSPKSKQRDQKQKDAKTKDKAKKPANLVPSQLPIKKK